ncbi:unnamed protein product [Paramecium pentaurelia]|uniref:Uncharacterized protein n=1 Tax=Paramecium pentaurelia TaxID=43138 RepID=A0A8S1TLV2_9CILI|nr:unnamed protein product [Paramecium pentaurelia]
MLYRKLFFIFLKLTKYFHFNISKYQKNKIIKIQKKSTSKLIYSSPGPKTQSIISLGGDRDRTLSPSRAKISQLSEKLSNLQDSIDEDQAFKKDTFEQMVQVLLDKAIKKQQRDEQKFKLLKEQLQNVEEGAQSEKIIRESGDEKLRPKYLKGLELVLGQELQLQKQIEKIMNKKQRKLQMIEFTVLDQIQPDKKVQKRNRRKNAQEIGDRILQLQEEVEEERRLREQEINKLLKVWEIQY